MDAKLLQQKVESYLKQLCLDAAHRSVGSQGNRQATDLFAAVLASFGFRTESPPFDCIHWTESGAQLTAGEETFPVFPSPYSLGCRVTAPLVTASTVAELENGTAAGKILLLRGELTKEQLMPKNFTFYNPDEHKQIIALLERQRPSAIIAATSRNPELAGGLYPFPLIEDGDFHIPSVYLKDEVGDRLVKHVGQDISLWSQAERIPSQGCNVIGRKGSGSGGKLVLCAHIDSKLDTPGAIDNASGVVILMLLAELLNNYDGELEVELLAFNGEDYYGAPGQMQYLAQQADELARITLAINMDVAGYYEGQTAYSLYGCPPEITAAAHTTFAPFSSIVEGEPWYQSDHSVFIQQGVAAMAITSDSFMQLSTDITHTDKDVPEIVDPVRVVDIALALRDLVYSLA